MSISDNKNINMIKTEGHGNFSSRHDNIKLDPNMSFINIKDKIGKSTNQKLSLKDNDSNVNNEDYDSDEAAFKVKAEVVNDKINDGKGDDDEGEELSSLSNDSNNYDNDGRDFLYTQYEKVHRVKSKWKCNFKDAVLQINGKEYIFDKITGELERDW